MWQDVCFTCNNWTESQLNKLRSEPEITYCIVGFEKGEEGTRHLQGYYELAKKHNTQWRRNHIGDAFYQSKRMGTQEEAILYCKKAESKDPDALEPWIEWGKPTDDEKRQERIKRKQGDRTDLVNIKTKITRGDRLDSIAFECNNYQQLKFAESLYKYKQYTSLVYKRNIYWYYGVTGGGKSHTAKNEAFNVYNEMPWIGTPTRSGFFNGYFGQKAVVIDDLRYDTLPFEILLSITGEDPFIVNVKGGYCIWEATDIWITTPLSIDETFTRHWRDRDGIEHDKIREDIGQLHRRVKGINNETIEREREFNVQYGKKADNAFDVIMRGSNKNKLNEMRDLFGLKKK